MMADLDRCDKLDRPTNYWEHYQRHFMPELKRFGLRDFRRRPRSVLTAFGATDLQPRGTIEVTPNIPGSSRVASALNRLVAAVPGISLGVWGSAPDWHTKYFYHQVKHKFDTLGLPLTRCGTTPHGNPEDLVEIDGAYWSLAHLQYCSMLADALRHVPVPDDAVICELGAGLGRNLEVLAHLFPRATLLLFDIPPQLYVANQYLSSVFGERVVTYDDGLKLTPAGAVPACARGRIVMSPSWRLPDWADVPVNLFWNSASFQEMEPDVVRNYLGLVARSRAQWIYINALPGGNYWGGARSGGGGTLKPVLDRYYADALGKMYELHVSYPTDYFLRDRDYMSYIYRGPTP